jgi:dihydrofolate reductase
LRKLIAFEFSSLDGVVQAPAYPDEDTSGGFRHGGWHRPYLDEMAMKWIVENVSRAGGYLLGRRTYELFAAHWPNASAAEQALAQPLNAKPKHVASRTLKDPLGWNNSRLLESNLVDDVTRLKQQDGDDLLVIGSSELVQTLITHSLVDEFRMMIDPVLLGGGKRLFQDDGVLRKLRLVDSKRTTTGATIATYSALF